MGFTVYIDESGESGIAKVRSGNIPGASPYFVLGAIVAQPATERLARKKLAEVKANIGKKSWSHATELKHADKLYLARTISEFNRVRLFSVISNKDTLADYKDQIAADPQSFYNKCVKYLLERVCAYLSRFNVGHEDLSVVLEQRNHDYGRMISYLSKVRDNPIYQESRALRILNPFSITSFPKGQEAMLDYADFVAHAVYQCVNKTPSNYGIPEWRYFQEISRKFAGDSSGQILSDGLKCIHSLDSLNLDADVRQLFLRTRVMPPTRA